MLAGAESGDGLGRMKRDRRGNVDGVDGGGLESDFEVGEDLSAGISGGLLRKQYVMLLLPDRLRACLTAQLHDELLFFLVSCY